jgi:CelD/BcsL family acetyltransferase involved in cellulose biosynthesis
MTGLDKGAEIELRWFSTLEHARDIWPTVADPSGNLFATWEWISTWWRHFGRERPLRTAVGYRPDGQPAVIIPLYLSARKPLTVLRFVGHGPGDWQGPIHAPDDTGLAAATLETTLKRIHGWDLLLAEHVRPGQRWSTDTPVSVIEHDGFPVLHLDYEHWEAFLAQRSRNLREQVRRRERRLARSYELTYRLSDVGRLDADMEVLFRLHAARWQGASDALGSRRQDFHREFARRALDRHWLRLWTMELNGQPVAMWYGFRYAGIEWYYQAGWDPAFRAESVGFVLLCHTIRMALEGGAQAYWFLRGGEPYKARFADEDPGTESLVLPHSFRGRLAVAALRNKDRIPRAAKNPLKMLAG